MDRDVKSYFRWWLIAALGILALNLLGCARPRTALTPSPTVVVAPIVQNNLDFLFFSIADRGGLEAWFCLVGFHDKKTKNVLIQSITPVWVDSADASNISGRPTGCMSNTVGTIHFHPGVGYCSLSTIDINTAHYLPYEIAGIVCRDSAAARPRILLVRREEFDKIWNELPWCPSCATRPYTPVYRYRPP